MSAILKNKCNNEEEDPFACFGSDEEDDDDDDAHGDPLIERDSLGAELRGVLASTTTHQETIIRLRTSSTILTDTTRDILRDSNTSTSNEEMDEKELEEGSILHDLFSSSPEFCKPIFINPHVAIVANKQPKGYGGRGYFAMKDIPPGTLLLVEKPILQWPDEQIGRPLGLISVEHALLQDHANQIIKAFELLHPTKEYMKELLVSKGEVTQRQSSMQDGDMDQRILQLYNSYHEKYIHSHVLKRVLVLGRVAAACNDDVFNVDDALRMLLALRFNAFGTGSYMHMSMFNHNCIPNCTKFSPEEKPKNLSHYSQVWTTSYVRKGQELTLHYLEPRELSHSTRRYRLFEQHLFDIGTSIDNDVVQSMEIVNGTVPTCILPPLSLILAHQSKGGDAMESAMDITIATSRFETALADLEAIRVETEIEISTAATSTATTTAVCLSETLYPKCKALELSAFELCKESAAQLNNSRHILMMRCYRLHTDCAASFLNNVLRPLVLLLTSASESTNKSANGNTISSADKESIHIGCRFILNSYKLLEVQLQALGHYHFDVARTYHDLWKEIGFILLSRKLTKLNQALLDDEVLTANSTITFAQWSREEDRCRREYERISQLYPHDIDSIIQSSPREENISKGEYM